MMKRSILFGIGCGLTFLAAGAAGVLNDPGAELAVKDTAAALVLLAAFGVPAIIYYLFIR